MTDAYTQGQDAARKLLESTKNHRSGRAAEIDPTGRDGPEDDLAATLGRFDESGRLLEAVRRADAASAELTRLLAEIKEAQPAAEAKAAADKQAIAQAWGILSAVVADNRPQHYVMQAARELLAKHPTPPSL